MKRISEEELYKPGLSIIAKNPGGITTTKLISELVRALSPVGEDRAILKNRNDFKFTQKVRNLISHRNSRKSMIARGHATYISGRPSGKLYITSTGQAYITNNK